MIKSPIQKVTNRLQYRAIGIVNAVYNPNDNVQFNRGTLTDCKGQKIETVILGKVLSLIKKYIDLEKNYYWIVYPKNKNTQNLHLQVAGIWDPYKFNDISDDSLKKDPIELLEELNLNDNYFSVRGEVVFVNTKNKEFVVKICSSSHPNKIKKNNFKLTIKGELSIKNLNSFLSLDVMRDGNTLNLASYEVIERITKEKIL
ncbi:hypothetical protein OAX47_01380 [Prochlorococcus sp. AH-736-K09]|nr:hypothetical protein [Prochlorococcus sp. AH-736-K09]